MWIHRLRQDDVSRLSQTRPAMLLTGPRQTGKSSLLQKCFKKAHYISLDTFIMAQEAEDNPRFFLDKLMAYMPLQPISPY